MRQPACGKLVVISGPMFSGKTSRLMEFLEREYLAGNRTVLFKPDIDNRYAGEASVDASNGLDIATGHVYSHKHVRMPAHPISMDESASETMRELAGDAKAIGIDEAQFFGADARLADLLDEFASQGRSVYLSVLNRDHRGNSFGQSAEFLSSADVIYSLTAVCAKCKSDNATFTQRVVDGKEVFGELIQVGGKDSYEPRCRACFVSGR